MSRFVGVSFAIPDPSRKRDLPLKFEFIFCVRGVIAPHLGKLLAIVVEIESAMIVVEACKSRTIWNIVRIERRLASIALSW